MKPLIAVPIGDPAGIGPEIVAKALCGNRDNAIAKISKRISDFCFLIVKSSLYFVML